MASGQCRMNRSVEAASSACLPFIPSTPTRTLASFRSLTVKP